MRVGLVTCLQLPEEDEDREPLRDALQARGVAASWLAWDDPAVDWRDFPTLVLRSTWNYHRHTQRFLQWVAHASSVSRLFNSLELVGWNAHKAYLVELAQRGLPVTPTVLLRRGTPVVLRSLLEARRWTDVVIKPAVSAGSFGTLRARLPALEDAQHAVDGMLLERDVLVQPYLASVEGHGERSIMFIDGEMTHSIRKSPRFGGEPESASGAIPIPGEERDVALRVMAALPSVPLYARVDLARDDQQRPCLMELELIEPSLFLVRHSPALERFADAIVKRAR